MKKYSYSDLSKKYEQISESTINEFDTGPGNVVSTAGGEPSESNMTPGEPETELNWRLTGLFEPDSPQKEKATAQALKDLDSIFEKFQTELESWEKKYRHLGARDTVSRECVAQYIAQSILGLRKLDHEYSKMSDTTSLAVSQHSKRNATPR